MNSHPPKSDTSFEGLQRHVDPDVVKHVTVAEKEQGDDTDFHTLNEALGKQKRPYQARTITDLLLDGVTPILIFIMVYAVLFFLLEVRFIYSEVHDKNLKFVAFCFVMGIVALNRVVATDSSDESVIYIFALAGTMGLYTLATTGGYDVGSVAGTFLDRPWIASGFNMLIVAIIWWSTNRLMHECCIDENQVAGDVGILTGTIRRFQEVSQRQKPKQVKGEKRRRADHLLESMELQDVDPMEWAPESKDAVTIVKASERLKKRHPGMSVIYYSIPVMIVFTLGLPVFLAGGDRWVKAGHMYVALYTVAALMLLSTTSLGGLREYFRARRIFFPAKIGPFWLCLATFMIAVVCIGALRLPQAPMPDMAIIEMHQTDYWSGLSNFRLKKPASVSVAEELEQAKVLEYISLGVLMLLGLFMLFFIARGLGELAAAVGRNRDLFSPRVVRFFDELDAFLLKVVRMPSLPKFRARPRVSRHIATSAHFNSPMGGVGTASNEDVASYVETSYDALCALAHDLGVPREKDQTPYEFLDSFPKALHPLKREAKVITELYVQSAYSNIPPDKATLDRLRKFWVTYTRIRNRIVR